MSGGGAEPTSLLSLLSHSASETPWTAGNQERKQKMYRMTNEALSVFLSHVLYHWTVGGTMMVFDSHCVDQSILLFLHHSRLEGSKNKVVEI